MSRSGYTDDYGWDDNSAYLYRGAVASAFRGRRGQKFLKDALAALDALPEPRLIAESLKTIDGEVCALGAVANSRGIDMSGWSPEDSYDNDWTSTVNAAHALNIADAMAREIAYINDEGGKADETPEERFQRIRKWIESEIIK